LSDIDKIIELLRRRPPEAGYEDVRRLLEAFGWTQKRQTGSHVIFTKPGERSISVPLVGGRRVKRVYLIRIIELLDLD